MFICYEIAYSTLVAKQSQHADHILTVSNDAWFGNSIGPFQHLQMAQLRALEIQKPIIRATNNGISGFITHQGHMGATGPQFEQAIIHDTVETRTGATPYSILGSVPVMAICGLFWCCVALSFRKNRKKTKKITTE